MRPPARSIASRQAGQVLQRMKLRLVREAQTRTGIERERRAADLRDVVKPGAVGRPRARGRDTPRRAPARRTDSRRGARSRTRCARASRCSRCGRWPRRGSPRRAGRRARRAAARARRYRSSSALTRCAVVDAGHAAADGAVVEHDDRLPNLGKQVGSREPRDAGADDADIGGGVGGEGGICRKLGRGGPYGRLLRKPYSSGKQRLSPPSLMTSRERRLVRTPLRLLRPTAARPYQLGNPVRVFSATFIAVHPHAELAAAAGLEIGVDAGVLLDERRHTGGAGQVISNHAVTDLDPCHGSNRSRRFQGSKGLF